jgi:pyridoxal phosphate enzyme (YggS family)
MGDDTSATDERVRADLERAYGAVLARVAEACTRAHREPDDVTVVAISKTVPLDRLATAAAAGIRVLGENRVQEAATKVGRVAGVAWHLVGPLQANKARRAITLFDVIETVDSLDLARRLGRLAGEDRPGHPRSVLLQVNVDADPAKAGFAAADLDRELDEILDLPNLAVEGLMTIGRMAADPEAARPTFRALRKLSERLRGGHAGLGGSLSMGMTDDFETAIEEGATHVRVGRAIFGERPLAVR